MNLEQQKEVINLYKQYQATDTRVIKTNLKKHMDKFGLTPANVAKQLKIPVQTIYQMRKLTSSYRPNFMTTMVICDMLKLSITEVIQPLTGNLMLPEPEPTRWNNEVKKQFINDYKNLDITSICKKWNITARTAQEYNKNFIRALENLL